MPIEVRYDVAPSRLGALALESGRMTGLAEAQKRLQMFEQEMGAQRMRDLRQAAIAQDAATVEYGRKRELEKADFENRLKEMDHEVETGEKVYTDRQEKQRQKLLDARRKAEEDPNLDPEQRDYTIRQIDALLLGPGAQPVPAPVRFKMTAKKAWDEGGYTVLGPDGKAIGVATLPGGVEFRALKAEDTLQVERYKAALEIFKIISAQRSEAGETFDPAQVWAECKKGEGLIEPGSETPALAPMDFLSMVLMNAETKEGLARKPLSSAQWAARPFGATGPGGPIVPAPTGAPSAPAPATVQPPAPAPIPTRAPEVPPPVLTAPSPDVAKVIQQTVGGHGYSLPEQIELCKAELRRRGKPVTVENIRALLVGEFGELMRKQGRQGSRE